MIARSWLLLSSLALSLRAQATDSAFWRRSDTRFTIGALAGMGIVAVYDERIARWARQSEIQGDSSRRDFVHSITWINEQPLTIAAVLTYGVGRVGRWKTVADVGAHLTEALVATELVDGVIRISLSRSRPRASPDDAFIFHPGKGLTDFDYRSFPSLHAAVAFATAGTLVEELRVRNRLTSWWQAPALYTAAAIPGFTRIYLDEHWASDIVAGTFVGVMVGTHLVRYAHQHKTRVDRFLLGLRVIPTSTGLGVGWSSSGGKSF